MAKSILSDIAQFSLYFTSLVQNDIILYYYFLEASLKYNDHAYYVNINEIITIMKITYTFIISKTSPVPLSNALSYSSSQTTTNSLSSTLV